MKKLFLLFFIFFILIKSLTAQDKKIAILIGNQNYIARGAQLKNPINDINEIKLSLEKSGFNVITFRDLKKVDFDGYVMDSIKKSLTKFSDPIKLFVHYAGHGVQINGTNYLVPIDIVKPEYESELERKCFSIDYLTKLLSELVQRGSNINGLISLDACRNNPFKTENMREGLSKPSVTNIFNDRFCFLFSVGIDQKASDGKPGNISPFAKGLIKGIENCENLSGFVRNIKLEYSLENLSHLKPYHEGDEIISFCDKKPELITRNLSDYEALLNSIEIDYQNEKFQQIIDKASIIFNDDDSNIDKKSIEYLQFLYMFSVSQFKIGNYNESFFGLNYLADNTLKEETYDLYSDVYYYLAKYFSMKKNWKDLTRLRNNYLNFQLASDKLFDAAITYDKIAGDFEHREHQDSAKYFYHKAINILDNLSFTEEQFHYASLIFGNLGKCYGFGKNINFTKGVEYLTRAVELSKNDLNFMFYNLHDLIGMQIQMDTSDKTKKEIEFNLFSLKNSYNPTNNPIEEFLFLDITLSFYQKYRNVDSISFYFNKLNNCILKQNRILINEDKIIAHNQNNSCEFFSRQISVSVPIGAIPILFFDKNNNNIYDDRDYKIFANNASHDTIIITELGANSSEQWTIYQQLRFPKTSGFYNLEHNNKHIANNPTKHSYCVVFQEENQIIWQFKIDCTELNILKSKFYVGINNLTIKDNNQYLFVDSTIGYIPMISSNNSLKYSMSTLE